MESSATQSTRINYGKCLSTEAGVKTLSANATQPKSLGGADPALSQWYESAYQYYNAVLSGKETQPNASEWNEFLKQMNWAYGQMQGGWNASAGNADFGPLQSETSDSDDPFGGTPGPRGNLIYNNEKVRVGFTGRKETSDIWGNDVTIDVAPLSATVTSDMTLDTRTKPPEQVLRVIVKDSATETESVYYIHDYADAKIQINTPKESQLLSKVAGTTWGQFKEGSSEADSETLAKGTKNEKGEWEYVAQTTKEFLEFNPKSGDNETHVIWGNARVNLSASDHATVQQNADGTVTLVVNHKDKSTDTYQIQKGYQLDLNAQEEYVSFAGGAEGDAMPAEYAARIHLNPSETDSSETSESTNSKADRVDGAKATYNKQPSVELRAFEDQGIECYSIYAPEVVTIHTSSYSDKVEVKPVGNLPSPSYIISVTSGTTGAVQDFMVYGKPEKIVIDGMNVELKGSAALDPTIEVAGKESDVTNNLLNTLMELTGKSEAQVLNALKAQFPTDRNGQALDTTEKLKTAIVNGTLLPSKPNKALLQLLRMLDDKFNTELSKANVWSHSVLGPAYKSATDRLVTLLKAIYPDHPSIAATRTETTDGYTNQWPDFNDITFDGEKYSYTDETEGNTTNLKDWS